MILLILFIGLIFLYGLFSARLERSILTAPMLFTGVGAATVFLDPELHGTLGGRSAFLHVAELGLVLLLFTDASRTDLKLLTRIRNLPARLLTTGLLLTVLLGFIGARAVFPGLSFWEAAIVGAILAPTDAGLGQVIISSPAVPTKIRQALNVEAGLNDGLSVPFLLFFIALAAEGVVLRETSLTRFILEQLGLGTVVGLSVGLGGGALLGRATRRNWIAPGWQQLGLVTLPVLCLLASEPLGASMFIAAFVAGLAVQRGFPQAKRHSVEFTEEWGQLFNLAVFFLFGLLMAKTAPSLGIRHLVYALVSLTIVRMIPVAIALMGTGLSRATVLFMGWFGPRGLASIVLGLVFTEQHTNQPGEPIIQRAVIATVFASIFLHGMTANPGIRLYAAAVGRLPASSPERQVPSA